MGTGRRAAIKTLYKTLLVVIASVAIASITLAGRGPGGRGGPGGGNVGLDAVEASHLTFMREEEKLARDVYMTFSALYPDEAVFDTIGDRSEQTHTDTLRDKLAQYGLPDPNPDANNLPEEIGQFYGAEWGWYFNEKYDDFTAEGSSGVLEALYVGAFIEELDMNDIGVCPVVMVEAGYPKPCGLAYTDERVLIDTFRNLIDGSENHLRAFVWRIERFIGEGNYQAQYLTQEEVDRILGR